MKQTIKQMGLNLMLIFVAMVMATCVTGDDFDAVDPCDPSGVDVIDAELYFMSMDEGIKKVKEEVVLRLFVTSSDQENNIYGAIYLQDDPSEAAFGIELKTGLRDAYLLYPPGTEVYLHLQGLYLRSIMGGLQVGSRLDSFGNITLGRIPDQVTKDHLKASCAPVQKIVPKMIKHGALDKDHNFMYVHLDQMQVAAEDLCENFATSETSVIRKLSNCMGQELEMVNSGYSGFSGEKLPSGNGTVEGILKYRGSKPQLVLNSLEGMDLSDSRCDGVEFKCSLPEPNSTVSEIRALHQGAPVVLGNKVLEVVVLADPSSGEFPDSFYVRDGSGAIRLAVEAGKGISDRWGRGATLLIDLNGLVLVKDKGESVIGFPSGSEWKPIPYDKSYYFIYKSEVPVREVIPVEVNMGELTTDLLGDYVRISGVQFAGSEVISDNACKRVATDCMGNALVSVFPGAFAGEAFPEGRGNLSGILVFRDHWELIPVLPHAYEPTEGLACDLSVSGVRAGPEELLSMVGEDPVWVTGLYVVTGVVISDFEYGNFEAGKILLQTVNGSILLAFDESPGIPRGSRIRLNVLGGMLDISEGIPMVGGLKLKQVVIIEENALPVPETATIAEAGGSADGQWISLYPVQWRDLNTGMIDGILMGDCREEIPLRLFGGSALDTIALAGGSGTIMGFFLGGYFYIGRPEDLRLVEERMDCRTDFPDANVLISEIADPVNTTTESNSRFIELYNASDRVADLSGWELRRYTNANSTYTQSSVITFDNTVIAPRSTLVIAANSGHFERVYGFTAGVSGGASSAADSNGDDTVVLVDENDEVIDVFGIPGKDGTGTFRDFRDGRARRKSGTDHGSPQFTPSQWEVYNGYDQNSMYFRVHSAPDDFDPGRHD